MILITLIYTIIIKNFNKACNNIIFIYFIVMKKIICIYASLFLFFGCNENCLSKEKFPLKKTETATITISQYSKKEIPAEKFSINLERQLYANSSIAMKNKLKELFHEIKNQFKKQSIQGDFSDYESRTSKRYSYKSSIKVLFYYK